MQLDIAGNTFRNRNFSPIAVSCQTIGKLFPLKADHILQSLQVKRMCHQTASHGTMLEVAGFLASESRHHKGDFLSLTFQFQHSRKAARHTDNSIVWAAFDHGIQMRAK